MAPTATPDDHALPAEMPILGPDEVHVWHATTDGRAADSSPLVELLSVDERARASRLHRAIDRHRYIVFHAKLRALLSRYIGTRPSRLEFGKREGGKPRLLTPHGDPPIDFSLSHSDGQMLIALSRGRAVGVDIEAHRYDIETAELGHLVLANEELQLLEGVPTLRRTDLFFRAWVRKEAVLKGWGIGLSGHPEALVVLRSGAASRRPVKIAAPQSMGSWAICDLPVGKGSSAAVAASSLNWTLRFFDWPGSQNGTTEFEDPITSCVDSLHCARSDSAGSLTRG